MHQAFIERRRSLRVALPAAAEFKERVAMPIKLLDISLAGILMSAPQPLSCGQKGRLNARLDTFAIDSEIEVTRVSAQPDAKKEWTVGARFVSLDGDARRAMQKFLDNVQW